MYATADMFIILAIANNITNMKTTNSTYTFFCACLFRTECAKVCLCPSYL